MGNAKPSKYVAKQWIDDKDSSRCYMCFKTFNPARRRHHCRCCGEIFCGECWGALVRLPPDYGYNKEVPACTACEALFLGKLKFLRGPRRIVLTRSLKENQAMNKPPLCSELVASRGFEVFFIKIAHWRPLNDRTHLLFAVSMRAVNTTNSSYFNQQCVEAAGPIPHRKGQVPFATEQKPRCSQLDMGAMRYKQQSIADLSDDDREAPSSSTAPAAPEGGRKRVVFPTDEKLRVPNDNPKHKKRTTKAHIAGDVQLDVAWSVSLDAILSIALDVHPEGDFISLETHQEMYRVQVADAEGTAVTAEQDHNAQRFQLGKKVSDSDDSEEDEDGHVLTSRPRRNATFRVLPEETNGLFMELQHALRLLSDRSRNRQENKV